MTDSQALVFDQFYHIYHRGNNREPLFFEKKNYLFFLKQYTTYIEPVATTYAYCLLNNHFHFCIRTKTEAEQLAYQANPANKTSEVFETSEVSTPKVLAPSQQFSNLFNSYAKSVNRAYGRSGSLFENKFGRKPVASSLHFYNLIIYIHRNAQKHGFVDDFRDWPWSSYNTLLSEKETRLARTAVLKWFDSCQEFQAIHQVTPDEEMIHYLIEDDFDL